MASGGHQLQQQKERVSVYLDGLRNEDLKGICRIYGQQVSGTKPVLVSRCQKVLDDVVRRGDVTAFEDLKLRCGIVGLPSLLQNHSGSSTNSYSSPAYQSHNMTSHRGGGVGLSQSRLSSGGKNFRSSPFYEILETLLPLHDLPEGPEMPQNRNTVKANLVIKAELGQRLRSDGNLKILLYCRESHDSSSGSLVDVKFPGQIEVKVNNNDVKHNFKGLKNKSGSTKPADITSFLQKFGGQENTIQITYALNTKRFSYTVFLARYVSADKLVERIKTGNIIAKEKVLRDMNKANADPDIAATSARMSLKDPISTMRISLPVRSSHCTHNQCFDGAMFLQLQEQAPQWSCPVCNKNVSFESLCVDKYFEDILNRTSKAIEKVDVEPNGDWKVIKEEDESEANGTSSKARASYDDDFEDLIELDEPTNKAVNGVKRDSFQLPSLSPMTGPTFPINTPPLSSREPSVAQSASSAQRSSNKRPQSAVIDLTLSDDEDDEPPRPAKRQSTTQYQRQPSTHHTQSYLTPISLPDARLPTHHQPARQNYTPSQTGADLFRSNAAPRPAYSTNNVSSQHTSMSPPNAAASPFSPVPASPAWPTQLPRPPTQPQHQHQPQQQQQHQHQHQQHSMFPPPNSTFPMRPTTSPSNPNPSNSTASFPAGGLRLPPMQTTYQPSSSYSPEGNGHVDLYQGWRNGTGNGFEADWDLGSYESSPG